jgi:hypothetical protein
MPGFYRIFDTVVRSELPLPELPRVSGQNFTLSVRMGEGGTDQFNSRGFERAFDWCDFGERVVCWCDRKADEYLFVFPHNATFHITPDKLVTCFLQQNSSMQMLRHLLLNQVIPRYLATMGRLILHASAVTLPSGQSVAFLGNSGFGKSTLVSSFHRNGAKLINDDCILIESGKNGVTVIGGLVGIRLFPDSVNAVFNESSGFTNYTPYNDKQQLFLKEQAGTEASPPQLLDAMFLLNDPIDDPADHIQIETVTGTEAMMAMIHGAFSLDPSDKRTIANNFQNVGQAISEQLDTSRLHYPRVHNRLGDVRTAIIEWCKERYP